MIKLTQISGECHGGDCEKVFLGADGRAYVRGIRTARRVRRATGRDRRENVVSLDPGWILAAADQLRERGIR